MRRYWGSIGGAYDRSRNEREFEGELPLGMLASRAAVPLFISTGGERERTGRAAFKVSPHPAHQYESPLRSGMHYGHDRR